MIVIDLHDLKVRDVDEREAFAMQLRGTHQLVHTSAEYSYLYARVILKGRFTPGEAAIAGDIWYSYQYATYVLKDRFPLGEAAIARYAVYSYQYAKRFNLKFVGGEFQPC